ncbi:MAG: regulatory protein RecX [Gemmatimonadaceae bacterium]
MAASAYEYALNLLTARQYTSRNLKRKLIQKGYPATDADETIDRLVANGILDDSRYAAQFARGKLLGPGASKRRIRQQLYQRGIGGEVADHAIDAVIEDEAIDLDAVVEKDARKKLASLGALEPLVVKRRLYAHLARRGYNVDEINRLMKKVLKGS